MMKPIEVVAGAAGIVLFAGAVLALAPELQLGNIKPSTTFIGYSPAAARGRAVYVDLGCMYCHSQQPRDKRQAPDEARGWGRPSTPGDYVFDSPHQLGTMRTGPDLLNIGARQPGADWHLLHLFQPRAVVPGSIMPSYPFLFTRKPNTQLVPKDRVVQVPAGALDDDSRDVAVVATDDALDLVAYLQSLDHTFATSELPPPEVPAAAAAPATETP